MIVEFAAGIGIKTNTKEVIEYLGNLWTTGVESQRRLESSRLALL